MRRFLPHIFATLVLASAIAVLLPSCGTRERHTVIGPRTASGTIPFSSSETVVKGRAVVVLKDKPDEFFGTHPDLLEIATLTIETVTYRLVESKNKMDGLDELLKNDPQVAAAFPDRQVWTADGHGEPMVFDNDNGQRWPANNYREQRSLNLIRGPLSWEMTQEAGGAGVDIAILDTGIDLQHPEWSRTPEAHISPMESFSFLQPSETVEETMNGIDDDGDGQKDEAFGHGTHVAGIVHLAAPAAHLMIYKVLGDDGRGTVFGVASAILAAVDRGAEIVNLSLGLTADDQLMRAAIEEAVKRGVAVVASAGNLHISKPQYPAAIEQVTAVTSITEEEFLADFSNYGEYVDLSAPGVGIVSTFPHWGMNPYAACSGGSMAAPFASGAIALHMTAFGSSSGWQAAQEVTWTAMNIDGKNDPYRNLMGRGRIDLVRAIIVEIDPGTGMSSP